MPAAPNDLVIEVRDLAKTYRLGKVDVPALCGVSFQVKRGEFVAIMGPSGSGKSTLLHLLGCLDTPTAGKILVDGVDYASLDDVGQAGVRNQKIGFIFQTFNLLANMNVVENINLPMMYSSANKQGLEQKIKKLLADLGMTERAHHHPAELSGGQRQRVAIARALINDPAFILADEPTGNLDSKTSLDIMGILKDFNEKQKVTIILVTHENDIAAFARRKILLRDGLIVSDEATPGKVG